LIALLAHADVMVSNDSGPMHIAAAVGTSIVALFGPETPLLYGPLRASPSQHHALHYLGLRCSPCMFVHDNKVLSCWFSQAQCMTGIAVADVFASVKMLLAGEDSSAASASLRVLDK
jgi:ADP-heptose:LPS heptosyltransferase